MENPKAQSRPAAPEGNESGYPKQIRSSKSETGEGTTRSVLGCGSLRPLSGGAPVSPPIQSARGLAHSKTWRQLVAGCFVLPLLAGGGPAAADTVFHDDFNGALNPAWSIVRPDAGYYSVQSTGLVLRCNSGDLWGSYNNALNVFLIGNPAPGDFTATAKLRWLVAPTVNWAQLDLLAYDTDDDHVRIDYTYSSGSLGIGRVAETGGVVAQEGGARVNFGTDWFWLQLRKQGTTYAAWYSTNGVAFHQATAPFSYGDGTPAMLGFVAMVDLGGQTATVLVDSFTVEDTPVPASNYTLDWWTLDGGGGTLANDQFTLAGTVGQPDASGSMTAGQYSLSGGYWAMLATAPPMPPFITSALTATGRVNRPFSYTITATGNPTGFGAGGLPAGLNVITASGLISGAPETAGTFNVVLSATNLTGVGTANLALHIADNEPVPWAVNGHLYQAVWVATGITWPDAQAAATQAGGYLATITSADEDALAYALVCDPIFWVMDAHGNGLGPWLGGLQPAGSVEPGGGWQWVTGEPMTYLNWTPGEPSNAQGTEDRLHFLGLQTLQGSQWNDVPASVPLCGYLIEYPQHPGAPSLSVTHTDTSIVVSWPNSAADWVLQQAPTLSGSPILWTTLAPPYATNATEHFVTTNSPASDQFFRLCKP